MSDAIGHLALLLDVATIIVIAVAYYYYRIQVLQKTRSKKLANEIAQILNGSEGIYRINDENVEVVIDCNPKVVQLFTELGFDLCRCKLSRGRILWEGPIGDLTTFNRVDKISMATLSKYNGNSIKVCVNSKHHLNPLTFSSITFQIPGHLCVVSIEKTSKMEDIRTINEMEIEALAHIPESEHPWAPAKCTYGKGFRWPGLREPEPPKTAK